MKKDISKKIAIATTGLLALIGVSGCDLEIPDDGRNLYLFDNNNNGLCDYAKWPLFLKIENKMYAIPLVGHEKLNPEMGYTDIKNDSLFTSARKNGATIYAGLCISPEYPQTLKPLNKKDLPNLIPNTDTLQNEPEKKDSQKNESADGASSGGLGVVI